MADEETNKENRLRWRWIQAWKDGGVDVICYAILSDISFNTTKDGMTWDRLSPEMIADHLKIARSTCFKHVGELEAAKFVKVIRHRPGGRKRGGRYHNEFLIVDPDERGTGDPTGSPQKGRGRITAKRRRAPAKVRTDRETVSNRPGDGQLGVSTDRETDGIRPGNGHRNSSNRTRPERLKEQAARTPPPARRRPSRSKVGVDAWALNWEALVAEGVDEIDAFLATCKAYVQGQTPNLGELRRLAGAA